jgi:hypothetical protein
MLLLWVDYQHFTPPPLFVSSQVLLFYRNSGGLMITTGCTGLSFTEGRGSFTGHLKKNIRKT